MKKTKTYLRTFFQPKIINEAFAILEEYVRRHPFTDEGSSKKNSEPEIYFNELSVSKNKETLVYDSEAEFFVDYRKQPDEASYFKYIGNCYLALRFNEYYSSISVKCTDRQGIELTFERFEDHAISSKLPEPPKHEKLNISTLKPKIFIGHGRNPLWRELKDHLTDKHKYEVVAYEVGSRAGHTIRDVLEDMLTQSSIAFLVLTGENRDEDGNLHARENVIHETGLFQGLLGFSRAIVLLEAKTVEFSNIHGIEQMRFSQGNIKEVFGDVIAAIKREFGEV